MYHASLPEMTINGKVGRFRFCQQCAKFEPVNHFEGRKKSCKRKLSMHNIQRTRVRNIKRVQANSTEHKARVSNEIEETFIGVHTPVKCKAVSLPTADDFMTAPLCREEIDLLMEWFHAEERHQQQSSLEALDPPSTGFPTFPEMEEMELALPIFPEELGMAPVYGEEIDLLMMECFHAEEPKDKRL